MPGKRKLKTSRKASIWAIWASAAWMTALWIFPLNLPAKENKTQETPGEIIKRSLLEKKEKLEFTIKRDIFSPDPMAPVNPMAKGSQPVQPPPLPIIKEPPKVEVDEKTEIENEIRGSLFYEGYLLKNSKNYALVSMNGEFYAVTSGDMLQDRIKITGIQRKAISVEVQSYSFEIQLKGDEENEFE